MWRRLRIAVLLVILFIVIGSAWSDRHRTTDWSFPLWVGVFPVNGDGSQTTERYIANLTREQFANIDAFFAAEARHYGVTLEEPVKVVLYPQVTAPPPREPPSAGVAGRIWWSLRLRYYTWQQAGGTPADIRVFVLYHDPARTSAVPHSLGLQAGLLGVVYAYADGKLDQPNNVVIAHEVLHALGATDKYDLATDQPLFPEGYGEPDAEPLFPQTLAEIMGGRIAISDEESEMPDGLGSVIVGPDTAREIRWVAN
jgi:hypothetical protein